MASPRSPGAPLGRIDVGGLSLGATHELLRTRLGARFARPTLVRLWEASRGNPFFALELASALQRRGGTLAPGDELPIPADLDELLYERIDALGGPALAVAHTVAALARPTAELVQAALGARFEAGLAEALQARILELDEERLRFTHPLLGTAVTTRQTPANRRSLHARLADIVPAAEERARHLALATSEPDGDVAPILEEAARTAHLRGATATAAELAEQALRLTPASDAEGVHRRTLFTAERLVEAGDIERAIALLEQARNDAAPGPARAAVLARALIRGSPSRWAGRRSPARTERALGGWRRRCARSQGPAPLADLMRFGRAGQPSAGPRTPSSRSRQPPVPATRRSGARRSAASA